MPSLIRSLLVHVLLVGLFVPTFMGCRRFMGVYDPATSANVAPDRVPFLKLPPSASNVGYWDDGYQQQATFNISEQAVSSLFPDRQFRPITEAVDYNVWSFGDLKNPPQQSYKKQTATAGLIVEETWKNGGGCKIVFDRQRQFCSYELVRW